MENSTIKIDKAAIGLSLLCVAHCLLTPIAVVILPALGATFLDDERFHYALLLLVLPTSIFSLGLGCSKHGQREILLFGFFGLFLMSLILKFHLLSQNLVVYYNLKLHKDYLNYSEDTFQKVMEKFKDTFAKNVFLQYEFNSQWKKLKNYANLNNVSILGDIPILGRMFRSTAGLSLIHI